MNFEYRSIWDEGWPRGSGSEPDCVWQIRFRPTTATHHGMIRRDSMISCNQSFQHFSNIDKVLFRVTQSRVKKWNPGRPKLDRLQVKWKTSNYRYSFVLPLRSCQVFQIFWHVFGRLLVMPIYITDTYLHNLSISINYNRNHAQTMMIILKLIFLKRFKIILF